MELLNKNWKPAYAVRCDYHVRIPATLPFILVDSHKSTEVSNRYLSLRNLSELLLCRSTKKIISTVLAYAHSGKQISKEIYLVRHT